MKRLLLAIGVIVAALAAPSLAQAPPAAPGWKVPRTPDGHPDLQGTWTTQTFTPLQRPKRYAGREFLTEAEADELIKLLAKAGVDPLATNIFGASDEERLKRVEQTDETHYNNAEWLATAKPKTLSSRRTSLIFDPPDGLIPPQTPEGQKRAAARRAVAGFDSYETRPAQERCIVWTHEGPPMMPPPYNDILRIMQMPGYVLVLSRAGDGAAHHPDGQPPASLGSHSQLGRAFGRPLGGRHARRRHDELQREGGDSGFRARPARDRALHPRRAPTGSCTSVTLEDPGTWTKPWSAEIPMMATDGRLYEYACHEGNYGLAHILSGARFAERQARMAADAEAASRRVASVAASRPRLAID